jgi:hypothetical protein
LLNCTTKNIAKGKIKSFDLIERLVSFEVSLIEESMKNPSSFVLSGEKRTKKSFFLC